MKSRHVGVAAEAFAAAIFARFGYDISVQYGANQPEYDLIIAQDEKLLKVSVKGSQDGSWGLTQKYLTKRKADYHLAIDKWLDKHNPRTIFCFVQFKDTDPAEMPRIYLATPEEVALKLKQTSKGKGDTILYEKKIWGKNSHGFGSIDQIPSDWKVSQTRIDELLALV